MHNFYSLFYTHKYQDYNSNIINSWVLLNNNTYQTKPNQKNENQLELVCYTDTFNDLLSIDINNGYIYTDCSQPITGDKPIACSDTSTLGTFNLSNFNITNPTSTTVTKYNYLPNNVTHIYPYYNSTFDTNYQNITVHTSNNISSVFISNIPYGNKIIKRYKNNVLISYLVDNTLDIGYLPNEYLNNNINKSIYNIVDLYTWSISLLSLIEQKEDLLIYKSLVSIINLYKILNINTELDGLPNSLQEHYSTYPLQRDVLNNAWCGYAILQALGYLSNRATTQILLVSADIKLVLTSIVNLILNCTHVDSVITGYDDFGSPIEHFNICSTYMSDIFINQYLCYFFDFNIYTKHNSIHKFCSESIYLNYKNLDYITNNIIQINIYKSLWLFYFNRDTTYLQTLFIDISADLNNNNVEYDINLLAFLTAKLLSLSVINVSIPKVNFNNLYLSYNGLYIRSNKVNLSNFLYLLDCSWGILLQANTKLFNPFGYKLKTDLIHFETIDLLNSLINSWPTGTKWTAYTSVYDKTTVIGSIFNAVAGITIDWSLLRYHISDGLSCNTSQGDNLDKWGQVLNYHRPLYQADYYYRTSLLILLNRTAPTVNNIKNFITNFLEDNSTTVTINKFPPLYYKNDNNIWVSRPWVGNKQDIDLINSQLDVNNNPCFYVPDSNNVMVLSPVYMYTGQVHIKSEYINIDNSIFINNLLAAGITGNIYSTNTFISNTYSTFGQFSINTI